MFDIDTPISVLLLPRTVRRGENSKSDLSFLLQMFFYVKFNLETFRFQTNVQKCRFPMLKRILKF